MRTENFGDVYPAESKNFVDIYPDGPPPPVFEVTIDGGPMSISHWGLIDLGRFGVVFMQGGAHWQCDGETFLVMPVGDDFARNGTPPAEDEQSHESM